MRFRRGPEEICLFLRDDEVHDGSLTSGDGDGSFPSSRFAENSPLDCFLAEYIQCILSTQHMPSFVPRHNFIIAGGHVGKLEPAILVGNGIIRVRYDHHFSIHPNVSAIAAQVDKARSVHVPCNHPVCKRERQVKAGSAVHVNCMKHCI